MPSISALPAHTGDVKACAEKLSRGRDAADTVCSMSGSSRRRQVRRLRRLARRARRPDDACSTATTTCHRSIRSTYGRRRPSRRRYATTALRSRSVDDKGQVFMHLKAIEAHLKQNGRMPVNIELILEGEEEVGGVNLDAFVSSTSRS